MVNNSNSDRSSHRVAEVSRKTNETDIFASIDLDGSGISDIQSPVSFLNHMLDQLARHGKFDLSVRATGDTEIDDHHTVEDIGIVLGQLFAKVLRDKAGLVRFGSFIAPLDEALSRVVIDISNRPGLFYQVEFTRPRVGQFDLDLLREFFQAFVNHAGITLHIDNLKGMNSHHQAESIFKAFARSMHIATRIDSKLGTQAASTKGVL